MAKYYLIAGEASGDLHASRLMNELKGLDSEAEFRFIGGDLMAAEGGTMLRHYRELAYMGFIPVLLHLRTILRNMRLCKQDIMDWKPDAVILIDYPGFNLSIAKYVKKARICPVVYYISPKIWAWKEYRIKAIKRDVDLMLSILPFEKEWFKQKHDYDITYVGNPTKEEIDNYLMSNEQLVISNEELIKGNPSSAKPLLLITNSSLLIKQAKPVIALLAGSRRQEIKDNLPKMIEAAAPYAATHSIIVAGAPSIPEDYYEKFTEGTGVKVVHNQTYALLSQAKAALVTSGTATLETALFGVPQAVCYKTPLAETPLAGLTGWIKSKMLSVKYISLVNLIAGREVVKELVADSFSVKNIRRELALLLNDEAYRQTMLDGYKEMTSRLGDGIAPKQAAKAIYNLKTSSCFI